MKHELQAELIRRYPKFFRKPGKRFIGPETISDLKERLQDDMSPFDERGIESGDRWFSVVDRLCGACEGEIDTLISQGVVQEYWPRVAQIKEKLGGLRFYVNGPVSNPLRALILQVENEAHANAVDHF